MNASNPLNTDLELSVIIPCYNERDNVEPLFQALVKTLDGRRWEAIFVDDNSPDGTIEVVKKLAQQDCRVRGLLRIGRKGLSSAVIEGVLASSALCIAVIDGDMQHDETRLPMMLNAVLLENYDFAVGSRHVKGGNTAGLANKWRHFLSSRGIWLSQKFLPVVLNDPMSGFFVLKRELFIQLLPKLSGTGFKILLDLVMSADASTRLKEVPFQFRQRLSGESKLDLNVMVQFLIMLIEKVCRGYFPTVFVIAFSIILTGMLVNFAMMLVGCKIGLYFVIAQLLGGIISILVYCIIYYHSGYHFYTPVKNKKLTSLVFLFLSIVGLIGNVFISQQLYLTGFGISIAGLIGAWVGMMWNRIVISNLVFYK